MSKGVGRRGVPVERDVTLGWGCVGVGMCIRDGRVTGRGGGGVKNLDFLRDVIKVWP